MPDKSTLIVLLFCAVGLILFTMIFSASESAYLSINKLRIRFLRNKKDKNAIRVGKMLDHKTRLLNTVLVANNIGNISISSILTYLALQFFGQSGVSIAAFSTTILLLIFVEITPKSIAVTIPEKIAFTFSRVVTVAVFVLSPAVFFFSTMSKLISGLVGIKIEEKTVSFTEEEIKTFIDVGEEAGVLNSNEKNMLRRVFKFTDLDAKDIMTPRKNIVAIPLTTTYSELIELSKKSHFSRFPVFGNDIDDIKGIAYLKDALFFDQKSTTFTIKSIMRPPLFILENKKMSAIQRVLHENNQNMAVVLDEYSGTAGILTMEDLAEEIFGSILDEHDLLEKPKEVRIAENEVIIDGSTRLIDINERLHIALQSEFYDTIGGYITEKLGEIPSSNAQITENGFTFIVLKTDSNHVIKVKVVKKDSK